MTKLLRFILAVVAIVIIANVSYLWMVSNFTLGLLLATILGAFLFLYAIIPGVFHFLLQNKFGNVIKILLVFALIFFVFFSTLITVAGRNDSVNYKENAIIVLGAGIHGETVSRVLALRLDAALTYYKMNPLAYIVVSGGQGDGETITEAEAMSRYLTARGIPADRIILEEKATSTLENFTFSKELLDERFGGYYQVGYITNQFHIFRADRIATKAGLRAARLHAKNDPITLLPDYLRECCAIAAQWFTW